MPKPIYLDPDKPSKKKKRRKKRKVDYTPLLSPPVKPENKCPHTTRVVDASTCSLCIGVIPTIVHKPITKDWWEVDDQDIEDISEELDLDLNSMITELSEIISDD